MADKGRWKALLHTFVLLFVFSDFIVDTTEIVKTNGLSEGGENVCEDSSTVTYRTFMYVTETYHSGYTTCCGFLCLARCQRYRSKTRAVLKLIYRERIKRYLYCCDGWLRSGSSCSTAICENGCNNGGTCVHPGKCNCPFGWTGSTCSEDINECNSNNGDCEQICVNLKGKENVCMCERGYKKDPQHKTRCIDHDECGMKNSNLCSCAGDTNYCGAYCVNTEGSYKCKCGRGYRLLGKAKCLDKDECSNNRWICGPHRCINSPGSFYCSCRGGFRNVNGKCQDIDECANSNGFCDINYGTCQNLIGGHRCICNEGFVLDGNRRTCSDIDECSTFHGCQEKCVNTVGSYVCSCSQGYKLDSDQITCIDIDECAAQNITGTTKTVTLAGCEQKCNNVEGSFHCSCRDGYALMYDKKHCKDVNECKTGRHFCDHLCRNTDGSYRCSCIAGYKLSADDRTCEGLPCEQIVSPNHGRMTCSGLVTNSTCFFSCDPGYTLTGSETRICQASSRWSGDRTTCKAKQCQRLTPTVAEQTLFVPCFTSFGSKCYFDCVTGFTIKGDGQASCSVVSESGSVSWKIDRFSCEESKSCKPNPCKHGGKCKVQGPKRFTCDCEGTGYRGKECQTGFISTPVFPKLSIKSKSQAVLLSARPSNKLNILLHSESGVAFFPSSSLEIVYPETKQEFMVEVEKAGIKTISYGVEGPNKHDFEIPEESVVFVEPRVLLNESVYSKLFVPKRELPIGCNEHVSKGLSCELHFFSTEKWTGSPPSTSGIVHLRTPFNEYIPLSMTGLRFAKLQESKKSIIEKIVALTSDNKVLEVFYINGETCTRKEVSSYSLLELMKNDALVSSFLRTFSKMAPQWLNLDTSEFNEVFDIQNIAVNLAQSSLRDEIHCSGFPLSSLSSISYFKPAINYELRVDSDKASLIAEGNTCFAADVCKQSTFINFSKRSANKLKNTLGLIRDIKEKGVDICVDSVGLLGSPETYEKEERELWNGTHFEKASPFSYNMWLKGDVTWKMQIPAKVDVTLSISGESFIYYNEVENLFVDRLTRPMEAFFKGKASYTIAGRALRQDFTLQLSTAETIGKIRLGGPDRCDDRTQGVLMSFNNLEGDPFVKTPFYPYLRPAKNQQIDVITLVNYNGGRQAIVVNLREIRRTLTNLRFLVPELDDIFREAMSVFPEIKDTLEKWIQTTELFKRNIREFRRTLLNNRAVDLKKVRELTAHINEKIDFSQKSVEVLKHRASLKTATSPLFVMIEDFQFGFPHFIRLKLGGGSTQQRMHGVNLYFRCRFCMKKLCLDNINAAFSHRSGNKCSRQNIPGQTFHLTGKASQMMSLSPGKILTLPYGQPVKMTFARNSEHVFIAFEARFRLLGISQLTNVTLDRTQLSLKVDGDIFKQYPTQMNVVAKIMDNENWDSLVYLAEGKMAKSSPLPSYFQEKINTYALGLAENGQRRIQNVETAIRDAKHKTKEAEKLLRKKQITLNIATRKLRDKEKALTLKRVTYAQTKLRLNSTLMHYLNLKNKTVCELKNCKYVETNTCVPEVCWKEDEVTDLVPNCVRTVHEVPRIVMKVEEKNTSFTYQESDTHHVDKSDGWPSDWKLVTKKGQNVTKWYNKKTIVQNVQNVKVTKFVCAEPITKTIYTGYKSPAQCCNNNVNVKILDRQCVRYNSDCLNNKTAFDFDLRNENYTLFKEFQNMTEKGKQVNLAQMEVNIARTQVRFASNQVKLARAFLQEQTYSEDSINLTSIKMQERLGLKLAAKMNSLRHNKLVSVESLSFSTSMTSKTKTLLPFVAAVKTAEGKSKFIEFPIDFKRIDISLSSASKIVVEKLFGTTNSREKRSTHVGTVDQTTGMGTGERMCFFSYQANAFFADITESLEFLLKTTKELFQGISSSLSEFDTNNNHSGEKSSSPSQKLLESFEGMIKSLRAHYAKSTSKITWDSILEQWRSSLNVLTRNKNLTECSGSRDCMDYFFHTLHEFYQVEYSHRAEEIKQQLQELKIIFASLLHQKLSFATAQEIVLRAKVLLNQTKDDSVLCGTRPFIVESSPEEVVVLAGDTANLTCRVENTSDVEISWIKNERVLEDMNDEVLVLTSANTQTEGAYRCEVSNNRGRTLSNITIIKVHQAPTITEHPHDVRVLAGTDTVSMVCNSIGVPKPFAEWFFTPMNGHVGEVVPLNISGPIMTKKTVTSKDSGFYYCDVSNKHKTLKSRAARLDVLGFTPGTPRAEVSLTFARCIPDLPENVSNCTDETRTSALHLDYAGLNYTVREIVGKMGWPWKKIEKFSFSPRPNTSMALVILGNKPNLPSDVSGSFMDALEGFSLSRHELDLALQSFRSAFQKGKFSLVRKNALLVARKGSFSVKPLSQRCPLGTRAHENGFICVICAPGYYGVANRTCLQCPSGTYQPDEGSTECLKCPFRLSLTEPGALRESQCIDISIPCKPPEITTQRIQALKETNNRYRTGETIVLGCEVGYRGIGNGTRECNEGNWTTQDFYCEKTCYPPWTELQKRCYKVIDVPSHRWNDASKNCRLLSSHMVTISSQEENQFAAELAKAYLKKNNMKKVQMWLGLSKVHAKAEFQWVNGTSLEGYTNWSPGEPNNADGHELCAEMLVTGNYGWNKWNDVKCITDYKSITVCEKPLREGD